MSSTSPIIDPLNDIEGPEFLSPLDDSWPFYQEIVRQTSATTDHRDENISTEIYSNRIDHEAATMMMSSEAVVNNVDEQEPLGDEGLELIKINTTLNSKTRRTRRCRLLSNESIGAAMEQISAEEGPSEVAKKLDHNAKERIRRMKLNASYLALRSLLPDSRRSKKRWSAPSIVDRVLKYIPELENEVETLRSSKEDIHVQQSSASKKKKKKKIAGENPSSKHQNHTVSVNKVNQEEAVVQICMGTGDDDDNEDDDDDDGEEAFMKLLQAVEDEGICSIKSASTVYVCETRICCHLHIQDEFYFVISLHDFPQGTHIKSETSARPDCNHHQTYREAFMETPAIEKDVI
ncbi:Transcription factor [Sesamum alatum]|uniref:Transcription factor n=1 Tax=Sesamum alatum TaxID=300844 RepID=A0AAE1YXK6_9LAMI|nr:Transcription factor [Sesamum alatum]